MLILLGPLSAVGVELPAEILTPVPSGLSMPVPPCFFTAVVVVKVVVVVVDVVVVVVVVLQSTVPALQNKQPYASTLFARHVSSFSVT